MPQQPVAQIAPDADQYDDLDTASVSALSPFMGQTADDEHAGVVLQAPNGAFSFTMPISQANDGFSLRAHINSGYKLAGIYHTHPGNEQSGQVFSSDDVDVANQLKVPSYILFQKTGQMRKYIPGRTKTQITRFGGSMMQTAAGDPVDMPKEQPQTPRMVGPDNDGISNNSGNAAVADRSV